YCGRHSSVNTTRHHMARLTSTSISSFPPRRQSVLQRKCGCGSSATDSGQCEECRKKQGGLLQRQAASSSATPNQSGGQSDMPAGLRYEIERLSHLDLSSVRVHYNSREPAK